MSHKLELPDELYAALLEAADASGLTPTDWIAVHLLEFPWEESDRRREDESCQDARRPLRGPGWTYSE